MAEFERTRSREREPMPDALYEAVNKYREEFRDRQYSGRIVVKKNEIVKELTRQGHIEWALHPQVFKDTALQNWYVFVHDVKKQSGKHTHQGGLVIFILEGKGWTVVDGVRQDWEAGDVVLLPMKKGGVEHQHFNADPGKGCKWMAFINMYMVEEAGNELAQNELSKDFAQSYGGNL